MARRREIIDALLFIPAVLLAGVVIFAGFALVGIGARFVGVGVYEAARHWLFLPHPIAAVLSLVMTIAAVYGAFVVLHRRM